VQGVPDSELALPFSEPVMYVAHGLLRKIAPWMLLLYRQRDAQELGKGNGFELLPWAERILASRRS
jgi:hypothetical protein